MQRRPAVDQIVEAVDPEFPAERHQSDFSHVAGLEPDGGARGNVEPLTESPLPVKLEGPVDLEEVEMGSDLDRPVAGIPHRELQPGAPGVDLDRRRGEDVAAHGSTHVNHSFVSRDPFTGWASGR